MKKCFPIMNVINSCQKVSVVDTLIRQTVLETTIMTYLLTSYYCVLLKEFTLLSWSFKISNCSSAIK